MKIVYYYDVDLRYCPVKKYLEKYLPYKGDKTLTINRKEKILIAIRKKIKFVSQNKGLPVGAIAKSLHGYSFFEIKNRKDKNIVIRILYFRYQDKIILLNAFEKSDNYKTNKEKNKLKNIIKLLTSI